MRVSSIWSTRSPNQNSTMATIVDAIHDGRRFVLPYGVNFTFHLFLVDDLITHVHTIIENKGYQNRILDLHGQQTVMRDLVVAIGKHFGLEPKFFTLPSYAVEIALTFLKGLRVQSQAAETLKNLSRNPIIETRPKSLVVTSIPTIIASL